MLDRLIRFSLTHRVWVLALAAFLIVYGLFIIQKTPVDVFPDLNRPTVTLMTEAPGMAPEEVETWVTLPLETVLQGLPGLERVRSSTGIGLSVIYLEFGWGTEIYRNRQIVAERVSLAKEKLPPGVTPVMGPISSIMGEILLIGLSSPDGQQDPIALRTLADWVIRPRLLSVAGVAEVIAIGGGVKQYQIHISAEKMQKVQMSLDGIEQSLRKIGKNTTGGYIDLDKKEYLIRNLGMVKNENDILDSVIGTHLGRPVLIRDIAEVKIGAQVKRGDGSINGKPAVIISVQKQPGTNTVDLTSRIEKVLAELQKSIPSGVKLEPGLFRQATFIEASIHNVTEALRDGTLLVFLVLLIFLANFRTTAITLTAIPLSFLTAALVFHALGMTVNTMTLGGLAIAIGELVDDAIVDVENVFRRLKENAQLANPLPRLKVIYRASSEVRNSIVLATVIVVLVFVPLFYLSGIEGRLFIPLGIAYIVSLLASLLVSLTVTPVLCSYLLTPSLFLKGGRGPVGDSRLVQILKRWDRRGLEFSLNHPAWVVGITATLLLGTLALIPLMGKDFLPKFNEGTATVNVFAQPGTSLTESNRIGQQAELAMLAIPEVKSVARRTGRAELDEHAEGVHYSEIDVDFKEGGRPREEVLKDIRRALDTVPESFSSVGQPISHRLDHLLSGVRAQLAIKVFGPDLAQLRLKAAEIHRAIETVSGLVDLQIEQQVLIPQVKIQLLREEAARYGIGLGDLADDLEMALNGEVVSQVLENQRTFQVLMRFDEYSRKNLEVMKRTTIKILPDGSRVTLSQVADVYESTGPNQINRENAQRRMVVSANVQGSDLGKAVQAVKEQIAKSVKMPEGYTIHYGGQFESQESASRLILFLGIISLLGVFMVLYGHFKSSWIAIQIMLTIPMALIGSLIAIYVTNRTFSVATLVALVTLCGIASRNGIMLISHYLHLMKEEGESFSREMIIRGSLERLVPVLMTALTAILGLLPLVIAGNTAGKEILYPVAVVIVGGLISSTWLDLFVTPTIFFHRGRKSAESYLANLDKNEF